MLLATRFIDPLFHSFFYMQYVPTHAPGLAIFLNLFYRLNIFYMLLEKMNQFADGKYDVSVPTSQISEDFEAHRGDSAQTIETLAICQKFISSCML